MFDCQRGGLRRSSVDDPSGKSMLGYFCSPWPLCSILHTHRHHHFLLVLHRPTALQCYLKDPLHGLQIMWWPQLASFQMLFQPAYLPQEGLSTRAVTCQHTIPRPPPSSHSPTTSDIRFVLSLLDKAKPFIVDTFPAWISIYLSGYHHCPQNHVHTHTLDLPEVQCQRHCQVMLRASQ